MIRAAVGYLKAECLPHWRTIVFDSQIPLAGAAVGLSLYWPGLPQTFTIEELTATALSYGATSLGFAITIYTLALTLPQPDVVRLLVLHREEGEPTDAYRKLLFIFSWTAVAQCLLVLAAFVARLSLPLAEPVRRDIARLPQDLLLGAAVFALAYALLQFLNAILAVAQLGRIIARKTRDTALGEQQKAALAPVRKHSA